jgi:putative ABC transport system permease protein
VPDWVSDVRYALRGWRRQPVFAAIAVLSLAAGIGLNTAVFSIVNAIFLQSIRGVPEPDRVAAIGTRLTFATFRDLRDSMRTLDGVGAWQPVSVRLRYRDVVQRRVVPAVSDEYFAVLGVSPWRGRFFDVQHQRVPVASAEVVVDFEFWRNALGSDPQAIGQTILINDTPATIRGIAPRAFHGFGPERPPLWMPLGMMPAVRGTPPRWDDPAESGWRVFGRIADGGSIEQVNAELAALAGREPSRFPAQPLHAATGGERFVGAASAEKRIEFLLVVVLPLAVVALILWIGCSNVANLLLARAAVRRKEIAIRMANGAGRARLLRLLLTESFLLALAGGAAGLLLAIWCRDLIWAALPEAPRLAVELDLNVLLYTGAVCIAATMLFGLVPALHATRIDVAPLLKSDEAGGGSVRRGGRIRTFFLVSQFAASTALLIVAGTFVRSVVTTHLGEQAAFIDRISVASIDAESLPAAARAGYWRAVRERIRQVPGVTALTVSAQGGERTAQITVNGLGPDERVMTRVQRIDAEFFRMADAAVIDGADLPENGGDGTTVLVNERAASQLRLGAAAVGSRVVLEGSGPVTIAGVVRDHAPQGQVYQRLADADVASANILVRTNGPATAAVGPIRSAIAPLATERASAVVATLREASTGMLQRLTGLALVVAALVLSLAGIGLYGSVAFITAQRTREIAIRMAIGAPRHAVLRMLLWEGAFVVLLGCAAGMALTGVAFQFMSGMIFATWTLEPFAVGGVLVTFAVTTLAACYVPGRRATRIDPIRALRAD